MATWTTIANTAVDVGSPIDEALMTALRDNPQAIAEGASGAPKINAVTAIENIGPVKIDAGSEVSVATLDIDLTPFTAYKKKIITFSCRPATDGVGLRLRVSTDGGTLFDAGSADYVQTEPNVVGSGGQGSVALTAVDNVSNSSANRASGRIELWDNTQTDAFFGRGNFKLVWLDTAGENIAYSDGAFDRETAASIDAVRLLPSSGNFAVIEWELYGWE